MTEDEARTILEREITDDGLFSIGWYLSWTKGNNEATLDGRFTAESLEAIAWWMKNKNE